MYSKAHESCLRTIHSEDGTVLAAAVDVRPSKPVAWRSVGKGR